MKYVFTLLIAITTLNSFAQHPNHKVWAFGNNAGLDFNTQPPTPITTSVTGWEAYVSQCDEQGNLLFYTGGTRVYDKQHSVMPGGDSLKGNLFGSTAQGVQVFPHPSNPDQYILLALDPDESYSTAPYGSGGMYYSVIDMSLNGGLGDVVPGQKNILIDSLFSEHMVIADHGCKMWLIAHAVVGPTFKCYEITSQGINTTPVVSVSGASGNTFRYVRGEMAYDPVRKHIFISSPDYSFTDGTFEIHDFDPNTGIVSNAHLLSSIGIYYRLCMSPNNTKLYATGVNAVSECVLDQFDITLPTAQDIINSKTLIHNGGFAFMQDMAVAPDSMIYVVPMYGLTTLHKIEHPDMQGLSCGFVFNALNLAPGTTVRGGLPSPSVRRFVADIEEAHFAHDAMICEAQLALIAPDNTYDNYSWSTGDTGTGISITQPGVYWVTATSDCKKRVDTFNVADFAFEPQVHDTVVCFASAAILTAPVALPSYLWSDGSTGSEITVTQPGTYWVFATDFCIETVDTFHVSFVDFSMSLPGDTVVCDAIAIAPSVDIDGAIYTWQDGSDKASYTASASGTYWVEVSKQGCRKADTMVMENKGISVSLGNDTLLCENITITLDVDNAGANYLWHDGRTGNSYPVNTAGMYSVLADNGVCSASDTIKVDYEKCDCFFGVPTVFTPNADGKNDRFNPVIEVTCPVSEYNFSIYNRFGECVFSATSPTEKWDGKYKGQLADVGTYMYMLQFTGAKGKKFTRKGDVTLVR